MSMSKHQVEIWDLTSVDTHLVSNACRRSGVYRFLKRDKEKIAKSQRIFLILHFRADSIRRPNESTSDVSSSEQAVALLLY